MDTIQWIAVPGFPDYDVSEVGTLRSWRRRPAPSSPKRRSATGVSARLLTGTVTAHGYVAFILRDAHGKIVRKLAHRLVALAFLPNPQGLSDVAHNDGNPSNNRLENLRWSTHRDNAMDMRKHGTMQDGSKSITAKLSAADVDAIRERARSEGRGAGRRICSDYGLSPGQVSRVINGKRWKHLPRSKSK